MRKCQITNKTLTFSSPAHISMREHTHTHTYQYEAAVPLPRHTAAVGLLLTAALLGHCFFETAANNTAKGESHFNAARRVS